MAHGASGSKDQVEWHRGQPSQANGLRRFLFPPAQRPSIKNYFLRRNPHEEVCRPDDRRDPCPVLLCLCRGRKLYHRHRPVRRARLFGQLPRRLPGWSCRGRHRRRRESYRRIPERPGRHQHGDDDCIELRGQRLRPDLRHCHADGRVRLQRRRGRHSRDLYRRFRAGRSRPDRWRQRHRHQRRTARGPAACNHPRHVARG